MKPFHLQIVTPEGCLFDGEAESLLVRTGDGDVEILRGHTDLFASVGVGRARLIADGKTRMASCSGGMLSVERGEVRLVAVTFEFADTIDINRARAAAERAQHAVTVAHDERTERIAKAKLMRALARISVYENGN
ncbi:MAG: ATP synthase F1 subunit epsilon [Clostridia bacterium]|nr:ATP synthase F1 subunit epsilon [Clostridia bacterium]